MRTHPFFCISLFFFASAGTVWGQCPTCPGGATIISSDENNWNAPAGNVCINAGVTINNISSINNGSTVIYNRGTITGTLNSYNGGSIYNCGTMTISGGFNVPGGASYFIDNYGTFSAGGDVNLNASGSNFRNYANATATFNNLTVNTDAVVAGSITVGGNLIVNSGATVTGGPAGSGCNTLTVNGNFNNNGTVGGGANAFIVSKTPTSGSGLTAPATTTLPTAPTSQPSALLLTRTGTTINGSFTAASPTTNVDGYLVLRSTGTSAPTCNPTNLASYAVGSTIGTCTVVAINTGSGTVTFSDNTLPAGNCTENAYYRIFSFKADGGCRVFNMTNPLTGNAINPPVYIWSGGNGNFTTAGNWTPSRTTIQDCDVLVFNSGTTVTPTNLPNNQNIGQWIISNNTIVSITENKTFQFTGNSTYQTTGLQIDAGSILDMGSDFSFKNQNTGCNAQISGTLRTADPQGFSGANNTSYQSNSTPTINLNAGSTVQYNAASGTQAVTPRTDYRNLLFSGGATKTLSATTSTTGTGNTVTITGGVVEAATFTLGEAAATNLTMTGGTLRLAKATSGIILPELTGTYTLTGGTVELYGTNASQSQTLRNDGGRTYHNVTINAAAANKSDAGNASHSGTLTVNGTFTVNSPAVYTMSSTNIMDGAGTFTLNTGAGLLYGHANGITTAACGTGTACGNVRTTNRTFAANSVYGFIGGINAVVSGNGLPATVSELIVRKANATETVTLSGPVAVNGTATFTTGVLATTAANLLTFNNGSTVSGASNASYVSGPVRKVGTTAFNFPVGGTLAAINLYRPIGISNTIGTTAATDHFTAQYFPLTSNTSYSHLSKAITLGNLSAIEHWILDRTNGTPNANVMLSWVGGSGVATLLALRVARWNGTQWTDEGNTGTTGTITSGTMTSGLVTSFSPFTLASVVGGINPLPVSWLRFEATRKPDQSVKLDWATASEENNKEFSVERSTDGESFHVLQTVAATHIPNLPAHYTAIDGEPPLSAAYYRIRQTDHDGIFTYSKVVRVAASAFTGRFGVYPNPNRTETLFIEGLQSGAAYTARLFNQSGLKVSEMQFSGSAEPLALPLVGLATGIYLLKISSRENSQLVRFVKL